MPTDEAANGSTDETSGQEQQGQQQATNGETPKEEQQQTPNQGPVRLPDDHPLVKAYRSTLEENRKLSTAKTDLAEANARAAKVTKLEEELGKRPTTEALETLQTRYDRLEAFLLAAGGPLGKALDSRTFTKDLFETDKDIEDLVKQWHKDNPSATSSALSTGPAGETGKGKHDPNELIRAAFRGSK